MATKNFNYSNAFGLKDLLFYFCDVYGYYSDELTGGSLGVIEFLRKLEDIEVCNNNDRLVICDSIMKSKVLRGTNLWILYNDLCDRDIKKVVKMLLEQDIKDIEQDIVKRGQ